MSNDINERFEYMEDFLGVMSKGIINIVGEFGLKTQETNRGKTAKKAKTKKKNLFDQAEVEDDEHERPGKDRLLQVSLSKQIETKIGKFEASHNEKIGYLENKMDKLEASQNEKMDKLEVKIDALSGLMAQLLDATQQKQE